MSLAIRLNWLILNSSFIFSCSSLGMTTALPISPGPSWRRDITAATEARQERSVMRVQPCYASPTSNKATANTNQKCCNMDSKFYFCLTLQLMAKLHFALDKIHFVLDKNCNKLHRLLSLYHLWFQHLNFIALLLTISSTLNVSFKEKKPHLATSVYVKSHLIRSA